MNELDKVIGSIEPIDPKWISKAYERLDNLTKPKRSLGYLEELAARYVAIRQEVKPGLFKKQVCVFAGDHGVVAEGVSAYPQEVTQLMVMNFIKGGAAINVLARKAGAIVEVIDIGVAKDLGNVPGLLSLNVRRGTGNIAKEKAMTIGEVQKAIMVGVSRAQRAADSGVGLLATGEMGIGNTTPATALYCAYLDATAGEFTGAGTGLDDKGIVHKTAVIEKALELHKDCKGDALRTLAALGGLEIAGICGLCLGAASKRRGVVVDGFISTAGALAAMRLCPASRDYMFFSHVSAEQGHRKFFEREKIRPIIDLGMRLGEGTGAAIAMQIIEDAVAINNEMVTFQEAGIVPGS